MDVIIYWAHDQEDAENYEVCHICEREFQHGVAYAWLVADDYPPICDRCLKHLCEWAHSEGFDVSWKDAYAALLEARQKYTEPLTTDLYAYLQSIPREQVRDEEDRIYYATRLWAS